MISAWVEEELQSLDLKDKRRNKRLKRIVSELSEMPAVSIPAAVGGGHAETAAAYRLFDNDSVEFEAILSPHFQATCDRMRSHSTVIVIQDTTEIDLTRPEQEVRGAGALDDGTRRGCLVHPLMAITPEGVPIGTISVSCWTRDELPSKKRRKRYKTIPIEEKESHRWITGLRETQRIAASMPETEIITVADSEADIYELIAAGPSQNAPGNSYWIVRACQNRALRLSREDSGKNAAKYLWNAVDGTPVRASYEILVRGRRTKVSCEKRGRRQARSTRSATVEVRATTVTLRAPYRKEQKLPDVAVNVVHVREVNPPPDEEPVEWLLLTSLPIDTDEAVLRVVRIYSVRWMVEQFFRVLKQGCRVESRRFEEFDRLKRFLAVAFIIAWRTLYVTRLGRDSPELDCEVVFDPSEWKPVYRITQKAEPPKKPPRLQAMIRMVAQLGGYVNRPRKDEPGAETIWKGLQRVHDIALCWKIFGPRETS